MNKFFVWGFLFSLSLFSFSQQSNSIDSLENLLRYAEEDTNKVHIYYAFSEYIGYEKELQYAYDALLLSQKLKYKQGEAKSYFGIGRIYRVSNYSLSLKNYFSALKIYDELNDSAGIYDCYFQIASTLLDEKNFNVASSYINKAMQDRKSVV